MGGFIKGIVVGIVSFGLGFAVLSVIFPVEPRVEVPAPRSTGLVAATGGADREASPEAGPRPEAGLPAGPPAEAGATVDAGGVATEAAAGAAEPEEPAEVAGTEETATEETGAVAVPGEAETISLPVTMVEAVTSDEPASLPVSEQASVSDTPVEEAPVAEAAETETLAPEALAPEALSSETRASDADEAEAPAPVTSEPAPPPIDETPDATSPDDASPDDAARVASPDTAPVTARIVAPADAGTDGEAYLQPDSTPDAPQDVAAETPPVADTAASTRQSAASAREASIRQTPASQTPEEQITEDQTTEDQAPESQVRDSPALTAAPGVGGIEDGNQDIARDPAPLPEASSAQAVSPPSATDIAAETPGSPAQDDAPAPDDASVPVAGAQGESAPLPEAPAPETETGMLLAPVPATNTPASEPLLPQSPETPPETPSETPPEAAEEAAPLRPQVQGMPSGAAGIAVNRGGAGEEPAVRRGAGAGVGAGEGGGAITGRLPTVGEAAAPPEADMAADTPAAPDLSSLPAVQRYAANPALMDDEVPLGVVVFDSPEAEPALRALALPLTIALDPGDPDAPRRAALYRSAGHEIALIATGVPALATPSDLAVTLEGWRRAFPEVVAIIDRPVNGLGASPALARSMAETLGSEGLGAIALRGAPDAWLGAARNAGLPTAPVYRDLGDGGQNEFTIRRLIDRGAFEALRQPGIVIAGSAAEPAVMSELAGFARGGGRAGVGLAPVTSVLQRR